MDNLQNGIAAFKAGKRDEARKYFIAAMRENPKNENVWGWLYQVSNSDNERIECLTKILAINPNNVKAQKTLKELQTPQFNAALPEKAPSKPPQKNNNNLLIGIGAAIVIVICCMCVAIGLNGSGTTGATPLFTSGYQVKYVLSGTARSAFVTYTNETGGTEQINTNLPWAKEMKLEAGAPLSIVAQNDGAGSITCEIWVNGEKKKTSTSTAQYGVVTCSDWIF